MKTISTNGNEFFYSIPGLVVPKHEVNHSLIPDMEYTVDWVSKNADNLPFLLEHHIDAFVSQMKMLLEIFHSIYARWLANDVSRILQVAELKQDETCRKLLLPFIADAHTLAIDIQMVRKNSESSGSFAKEIKDGLYDEIGLCRDVIDSMNVISSLLEISGQNPDFEKILDIAVNIPALKDNKLATPLFSGITSKNIKYTKHIIDKILSVYLKKISDINASSADASCRKKLLIVDDMTEILSTLTLMLENHYHVFPLSDGRDALALIDSGQSPDAFILDIEMPAMDGFTLAKNIRSREKHKNTPIVFLTGDSTRETVIKACLYHAKAFIVKPANKDIILSKLSSCLS